MKSTTKPRIPCPYEATDQIALAKWLDMGGVLWCHVPNGEYRSKPTGARLKRMGLKKGVPDVMIFTPPPALPGTVGVALELKRLHGGTVTQDQRSWHEALRACHWMVLVARGLHAAIKQLEALGY